jgi:nucleotide-binding universal stress UspA family protein
VELKVLVLPPENDSAGADVLHAIEDQARQVGRKVAVQTLAGTRGADIVQQAKDGGFDLIVVPLPDEMDRGKQFALPDWIQFVLQNARCRVLLVANPVLPTDLAE